MTLLRTASSLAILGASLAAHAVTYDFESIAVGTSTPLSSTVSGLTATFTSTTNGAVSVQDNTNGFYGFVGLTGHVLLQTTGSGQAITAAFSSPLRSLSTNFATTGAAITLTAFLGALPVGTATATGTPPPGSGFPEGTVAFSGATFDRVVFAAPNSGVALDNIVVTPVPEPSALAALGLGAGALVKRRRFR